MKRYIRSAIMDIGDEDKDIRKDIAKSSTNNTDILEQLSRDPDRKVREQVAKNPNTPPEILERLSKDKSYLVCKGVAGNKSTSSDLLRKMSDVKYSPFSQYGWKADVWPTLFKNPNTPLDCRINICKESSYALADAKEVVARSRKTPPELLDVIYECSGGEVLNILAENPSTPADTLRKLYSDSHCYCNSELAHNRNTPVDILQEIFTKNIGDDYLMEPILKNPQIKGKLKQQLQEQLSEHIKRNSLSTYVGKDIWIEAESYGISRDFDVYIRLLKSTKRKHEYVINEIWEYNNYWRNDGKSRLLKDMKETYTQIVARFGTPDVSEEIVVYGDFKTYTTEELIKKLCGEYESDL